MDSIMLHKRPSQERISSLDSTTITQRVEKYVVKLKAEDVGPEPVSRFNIQENARTGSDNDTRNHKSSKTTLLQEFDGLVKKLQALVRGQANASSQNKDPIRRVFLTGGTGYVGTQVLRQLIEVWDVDVVVLVRGSSEHEARLRVVQMAKEAKWWSAKYADKFQVWLGDLAAPNLGLSTEHWRAACGEGSRDTSVQAFIHAGAVVDWKASAAALWSANVCATYSMLEAAIRSPYLRSFAYLSGDANDTFVNPVEVMRQLSNGYCQTKALGQILVRTLAMSAEMQKNFKSFRTGFVIGTPTEGIASTDNIFWRFVATVAELRSYSHEQSTTFINVATVDAVAHKVIEQVMTMRLGNDVAPEIVIRSGVQQSMLWQCLARKLGYKFRPMLDEEWQSVISTSFDRQKNQHKLSAFRTVLERQEYALPSMPADTFDLVYNQKLYEALNLNISYLQSTGFLPAAEDRPEHIPPPSTGSTPMEELLEIFFAAAA